MMWNQLGNLTHELRDTEKVTIGHCIAFTKRKWALYMLREIESEVAQSLPTLCDPRDCSPPGFSVHGIFQARVLEWGAIAFSRMLREDLP